MSVIVIGQVRFTPENLAKVKPHIAALVRATNENDGCLFYDVAEDVLDPGLVRFSEEWPDFESLQRHIQAPHIPAWRAATAEFGAHDRKFTVYDASNSRPL